MKTLKILTLLFFAFIICSCGRSEIKTDAGVSNGTVVFDTGITKVYKITVDGREYLIASKDKAVSIIPHTPLTNP